MENISEVSVIMSVYNEPLEWLCKAIDSILGQTFTDFEFIIINDNPQNEGIIEELERYRAKDSRIIILKNKVNIGLTKSLNIGLLHAKGKYIARMDADDISEPNRFQTQYNFMEKHPDCVVCGSWMLKFNDSGLQLLVKEPTDDDEIKSLLLMRNCIAHPTVFMRREVLLSNLVTYNEGVRYSQDYDLFSRLAMMGKLANIPEPLLRYRQSGQQISSSKSKEQRALGYGIAYKYFKAVLKSHKLSVSDDNLLSKIKSLRIDELRKKYLISSYYSNARLQNSVLMPIVNGDLFKLKDLYLSCVKRSYFKSHEI